MKLDILVFAAHPDDAELGCGGLIAKYTSQGKAVGIIDLTQGELGTRGTIETRKQEAAEAASILKLTIRENLKMRDGFFVNDEEHRLRIIEKIRQYQPDIVIANAYEDRHPDHGRGQQLVEDACFLSGLAKIPTTLNGQKQQAFRPNILLHYIQDRLLQPDILLDVSEYWDIKIQSIKAYKTQFYDPSSKEPSTYISSQGYLDVISARAQEFGKYIGARYAEGFLSKKYLGVSSIFDLK